MPLHLNLSQSLQQKQLQRLSPQQVQLLRLMQVPTMDMEQRVKEEIQENPALEEGEGGIYNDEVSLNQIREEGAEDRPGNDDDSASDARVDEGGDFDVGDYLDPDREDYAYKSKSNNYRDKDDDYRAPIRFRQGLQDRLRSELGLLPLQEKQREIGEVIIGNLDSDGYLQRSVPAMVNDMAFSLNLITDERETEEVLQLIQTLEPSGIGARDLRECLLIQIRNRLNAGDDGGSVSSLSSSQREVLHTAEKLLEKSFEDFTKRRYNKIAERLKVGEAEVKAAAELIRTLDPKPGHGGSEDTSDTAPVVIPDFYLYNEDGNLVLSLHAKNDPNLRVNPSYEEMLAAYGSQQTSKDTANGITSEKKRQTKEAALFVKQKIDSARWFMEMIRQRKTTMMQVMQAIVDFQHDFFLDGDVNCLRPMRLKDIAPRVNLDVSTVSRVINNKYIQTHFGTFQVKRIFSQGMENEEGEEVSTTQIKAVLGELIAREDKREPLTDEALVVLLKEKGFSVARRTVAKYREGLGLPVARLRRQL